MFNKNKSVLNNTRHHSVRRVTADQIDCKVLNAGRISFNTNSTDPLQTVQLYVSETGSDTDGNGSQDKPFATLARTLEDLSQTNWTGGANIFVDGNVVVAANNFECPLTPSPGISGKSYEISIKGANVSAEGLFTVSSLASWSPGSLTTDLFTSITISPASTTASAGKMIHFKSGGLAGLRVPIYSSTPTVLEILDTSGVSVGDQFEIETYPDSLSLTGPGQVVLSSLSSIPLCIRTLNLVSDGSFFTSTDRSGLLQLLGVKVDVPSGTCFFDTNLFAQGVWVTGGGCLQSELVSRSFLSRVLVTGGSTLLDVGSISNINSVHTDIVSSSSLTYGVGNCKLFTVAVVGVLTFDRGCTGTATAIGSDGGIMVTGNHFFLEDIEATGAVNGITVTTSFTTMFGIQNLHDNSSYGIEASAGSFVGSNGCIIGENGVAGIHATTGSAIRLPSSAGGTTVSGPVGPATDCYRLNGGAVAAVNVSASDVDFSNVAFF